MWAAAECHLSSVELRRSVGAGDAFCAKLLQQMEAGVPSQRMAVRRLLEAAHAHHPRLMLG